MNTKNRNYIINELGNLENIDCIGVTFSDGKDIEAKCYRYDICNIDSEVKNFATAKNDAYLRKYYRLKPSADTNYIDTIKNFIQQNKCTISTNMLISMYNFLEKEKISLRMTQLGVQNPGTKEEMLKIYFSLRHFETHLDIMGKKQTFHELRDTFEKIKSVCELTEDFLRLQFNISNSLEHIGYYPSLLGINYSLDTSELKIYYELFEPALFFQEIKEHTEDTLEKISKYYKCSSDGLLSANELFYSKNFFLRGIALSNRNINGNTIQRLYYAPMNRFV